MLEHNGVYEFGIGILTSKRQQDQRKAYEALACKYIEPQLNRRVEGNNIVPN